MASYQTRSGRRSQPALRYEDEMMDRQMAVRSQPRRDIVEEPAEEEQEVAVQPAPQNLQGSQVAGVQNAADDGTQGTQAIPATQLPDLNSLPTLEEAHSTYIPTHKWPPKCVRPELARCLSSLWQRIAASPSEEKLWIMVSIFFRCIIPAGQGTSSGDQWSHIRVIKERLRRWQEGKCGDLWVEAVDGQQTRSSRGRRRKNPVEKESQVERNSRRCTTLTQEGQYTRALQALASHGIEKYSVEALEEMRHKIHLMN